MKRILLFLVVAVLLLTGTASANLTVYEYVTGEKVTLDTATGNYWYWNLVDFVNMTYFEQISAIDELGTYGHIAGGWHMASLSEMQALWTYSGLTIKSSFHPPGLAAEWAKYDHGRYDFVPYYVIYGVHGGAGQWVGSWYPLGIITVTDGMSYGSIGAWVVTDAPVVPSPSAVVLATTGLLCLLGAKLRGRRR